MIQKRLMTLSLLAAVAITSHINAMLPSGAAESRFQAEARRARELIASIEALAPPAPYVFFIADELFEGTSVTGMLHGEIRTQLSNISLSTSTYPKYREMLNNLWRLQQMHIPGDEELLYKELLFDVCWKVIQVICSPDTATKLSLKDKLGLTNDLITILTGYSVIPDAIKTKAQEATEEASNVEKIKHIRAIQDELRTITKESLQGSIFSYTTPSDASSAAATTDEEEDLYS